jgi:hypothetical protein
MNRQMMLPPSPPYLDDPSDTVNLEGLQWDLAKARSRRGGGWRYIHVDVYTPTLAALVAVYEAACSQIDSAGNAADDMLRIAVHAARGQLTKDEIGALFACYDPTGDEA